MHNPGHHLAELNVGRLGAPTEGPRVTEFMGALDRVNGLGKRKPGFVWMMECFAHLDTLATRGPTDAADDFPYLMSAE